jgi:radical SAM superfamily enzyme YgiQ (UPF0313 family)
VRILLVWPNSRNEVLGWGDLGAIAEPLALEYLAAGTIEDGHTVRILDLRLHPTTFAGTLTDFKPDVVGVTAFSMHVLRALEICREAKVWNPQCTTVAGGHHATLLPEDFFEAQLDYVVSGEGVRPFKQLLGSLSAGNVVPPIAGIWARNSDGAFVSGGEQSLFEIDELPLPDRAATTSDRSLYFIDWMRPVALLRTSVGCPFRCTFCSLWKIMEGKYHIRIASRVVEELAGIVEDWVFLVDDEAFINGRRMRELAAAIKAKGLKKRFFTYARIDSVIREQEALRAWRDIGLERLFIGVDAISESELRRYNKRCQVPQIEEGLRVAAELGIEVFAQFVVSPEYERRDFDHLKRFIEHHRIRYPSFTVLTPIPGTSLLNTFDSVIKRQPNGRPNWELFDCQNAVTQTRLSAREFRQAYRDLYHVFKGSYTRYRERSEVIRDESLSASPIV